MGKRSEMIKAECRISDVEYFEVRLETEGWKLRIIV